MRVLFDQGTPVPLRKHFAEHDVVTAFEAGWSELSNGELLAKAEEQFDVLITTDKQLRYQQNTRARRPLSAANDKTTAGRWVVSLRIRMSWQVFESKCCR